MKSDIRTNMQTKQTWLLLGATGRIGRMLMRHWQTVPPDGVNIFPQRRRDGIGFALEWDPLESSEPLLRFASEKGRIDGIIVLSGVTPSSDGNLSDNWTIADSVIKAAIEVGVPRVLMASSSAVYGIGSELPYVECNPTNPANEYGRSKLAVEDLCEQTRRAGVDICALRIGNVAGADALLMNAERSDPREPLVIDRFKDCKGPVRSYIGPITLARVLESLMCHLPPLPLYLNVAAPVPVHMTSLADTYGRNWRFTPGANAASQKITLNCSLLETIHSFSDANSSPSEMIAEWKTVKDPS